MKIDKIYTIDTMGRYPIALIRYEGCSPAWRQYQNDEQIKEYLKSNNNYEVNSDKRITDFLDAEVK